jgi:hypothetical protein
MSENEMMKAKMAPEIRLDRFLSGPQSTNVPVHIFSQIQWQGDPTIAAPPRCRS